MPVTFILGGVTPLLIPWPRGSRIPCSTYFHPQSPKIMVHPQFNKVRVLSVRAQNNILPYSIDSRFDCTGRRVTIGDVVNKDALKYLQYDINGTIQVSGENVVYVSPRYYRLKRTLRFLNQSLLEKLKVAAVFLLKLSFTASLFASSLATLSVAVSACLIFKFDVLIAYLGLLKHVFSGTVEEFVLSSTFGDRDPDQVIEKKRWKMIGQYIALNGGVVTAEEIAPYLDPQNTENMADESYMLPVLQLFNGQPKVDEEGNILYHFPSVHCIPLPRRDCGKEYAGRWVDQDIQLDKFLKEAKWEFRKFSIEDSALSILCFNLLSSSILWGASTMLRNGPRSYMSHIFLFLLKMYVVHFFSFMVFQDIIASFRRKINAEISKRNEARERSAKALDLPDLSIKGKLLSARNMARRASIGNNRIVYKIENDLYEHQDYERQNWDRKLEMKIQNGRPE